MFLAFGHLGSVRGMEAYAVCDRSAGQESSDCICIVFPYLVLNREEKGFNIECGPRCGFERPTDNSCRSCLDALQDVECLFGVGLFLSIFVCPY